MAVRNTSEMPARWEQGVQGKQGKFAAAFDGSRDAVLAGLREIGANPGPNFSSNVRRVSGADAAARWASKVQGKGSKFLQNWLAGISY